VKAILNKIRQYFNTDYFGLARPDKNIQLKLAIKAYHRTDAMIGFLEESKIEFELANLN